MKSRILRNPEDIKRCVNSISNMGEYLPIKVTVEPYKPTRSVEQNDKMWALLGEVSAQVVWHGQKLSSDDWKNVFSAALKGQRTVPGIDGGFVVFGTSTSKMTVTDMMDMIELIYAFGAEHDVVWKE